MIDKNPKTDRKQLERAIVELEKQRAILGDEVVDAAQVSIREKLSSVERYHPKTQQRKLATVLFMDIVGSTSMSRDLDPEDTMTIMNAALRRLAGPVRAFGGQIANYMGDGFLAVFGAPVSHENDPEMGVRAGLQILSEAKDYSLELSAEWNIPDFEVRVGISTGLVIIGGDKDAENTLTGKTVNLAARLESAARPGTVLISDHTYQYIHELFDLQLLDPIEVKGFASPILVYSVIGAKRQFFRTSTWSVAGIETRMVARDAEMLLLQNMFHDAAEDAESHVVTVLGDSGVGKSRLLYEFEKWSELLPEAICFFKGRATPEAETVPYGLIRRMFANRFNIKDSDSADRVQEKFRTGMAVALNSDQADLVGHLLGFYYSPSQPVQAQVENESFVKLATTHLVEYFRAAACEPTMIFLEDIHWADDSSLDLLDNLVKAVSSIPLLMICLARPPLYERRPNWGTGQAFSQITLKPLSRRASRALVSEILQKVDAVPGHLRELIIDETEGNPFYIEELIKMLIEDGVIVHGDKRWTIETKKLSDVRVPMSLAGVIQARLDSLPPAERAVLQRASVVGRIFWDAVLVELADEESQGFEYDELPALLDAIRRRELVLKHEHSTFKGTDEFIFKHSLLREVTYETVLLKQRKVYHRQVAAWLERIAGERAEEYLGLIAGHYELAGDQDKAVEYLQRAGDRARLAYAHQEAVEYYQRALVLLQEHREYQSAARTLMKLGLVYHTAFDYERSREAYEQGFAMLQQSKQIQPSVTLQLAPHAFRMARANPSTLDPTMADDSFSGGIISQLFSGLVEGRLAMEAMPDVASSWDLSADGRRYVFHLRKDVQWSDGAPVTAGDFEYAWKRVLNPARESPNASLLYDINGARAYHEDKMDDPGSVGVSALDEHTLVVELEGPTGYFLSLLAHYATFPVPRHALETYGDAWTDMGNIVTNGAFTLEKWKRNEGMTLARNHEYHGQFAGNLQQVQISFDVEWPKQMEMYERGDLDLVSFGGTPSQRDHARLRHGGEYASAPMMGATYIGFDVSRPPFDDSRVRRAFALATDKATLAGVVLRGYEFPALGGFVPPGMPGHTGGIGLPYDPGEARRLLMEAGFPNGDGFPDVKAWTWQGIKARAECLQSQWRKNLGVEIGWEVMDFSQFIDMVDKVPVHMVQTVWMPDYPDPDSVLRASPIRRRTHWQNDVYDGLVDKAHRVLDQGERLELYAQADRIMVEEDAVVLPLTYMWSHMLVKPWVGKLPASAINEWLWKVFVIEEH